MEIKRGAAVRPAVWRVSRDRGYSSRRMSLPLGAVASLPLEDRAAFIERFGQNELAATIQGLKRAESPCGWAVTPSRLAWAMAFNVRNADDAPGPTQSGVNLRFLGGTGKRSPARWTAATQWTEVWHFYVEPRNVQVFPFDRDTPLARTLLRELARSVASEERDDWPWSQHRVDNALTRNCREEVQALSRSRLEGFLSKRAGWLEDPNDVINATWLTAIEHAWGPKARHRFMGCSLISTWLCGIALNVARDMGRARELRRKREEPWSDWHASLLIAPHPEDDAVREKEAGAQALKRLREYVEELRDKDRDLLRLLIDKMPPSQIAATLGRTPARVSQIQESMVRNMRLRFPDRQVRTGTTMQKVLKAFREQLARTGYEVFPSLKNRKPSQDEP